MGWTPISILKLLLLLIQYLFQATPIFFFLQWMYFSSNLILIENLGSKHQNSAHILLSFRHWLLHNELIIQIIVLCSIDKKWNTWRVQKSKVQKMQNVGEEDENSFALFFPCSIIMVISRQRCNTVTYIFQLILIWFWLGR